MFDLLSLESNEAFDVAKVRVWADKRWTWHPEYLIWGLLQRKESAVILALHAINVDVRALAEEFEKRLGPETKTKPKEQRFEQFGKEFGPYLFAIKKHYGYGRQEEISSLDLMEGFTRFGPRRIISLLKRFGVTAASLKRARKAIGRATFEAKGQTEKTKRELSASFEQFMRDGEDPKKFGFESWEQVKDWLKNL